MRCSGTDGPEALCCSPLGKKPSGCPEGYGVFTVGCRERDAIERYIAGQEDHHGQKAFREELVELLNDAGVEFDPKYLP